MNFIDGANEQVEYTYDANGNMTSDKNKKVESIEYNLINLPDKVNMDKKFGLHIVGTPAPYTQESVINRYAADGTLHETMYATEKSYIINPGTIVGTPTAPGVSMVSNKVAYCGNIILENDTLSKILLPDGYITKKNNTFAYHHYIKDHQGNNRVVTNDLNAIEQVNHYYPFGGLFGASTNGATQKYKYNDKELERMHGLDWYNYGARIMDPVGRMGFLTICQ